MSQNAREIVSLDKTIHEPARLAIMAILAATEEADFLFLAKETGLSKGNLSTHISRLEEAGYITVTKTFNGKLPHTTYALTRPGRAAFARYYKELKTITSQVGRVIG